jgi:hypothetical protein
MLFLNLGMCFYLNITQFLVSNDINSRIYPEFELSIDRHSQFPKKIYQDLGYLNYMFSIYSNGSLFSRTFVRASVDF